jgi:transposase
MGGFAAGPGGGCVCPKCGQKVAHQRGAPCASVKCPACGTAMARDL